MDQELIIVLDFGGQYNQLIARRVRDMNVYCEVLSYKTPLDEIRKRDPKGIILTGGPNSVYDPESPHYDKALFDTGIPVLGICYGSQLMAYTLGGRVESAKVSEYGKTEIDVDKTIVRGITELLALSNHRAVESGIVVTDNLLDKGKVWTLGL